MVFVYDLYVDDGKKEKKIRYKTKSLAEHNRRKFFNKGYGVSKLMVRLGR